MQRGDDWVEAYLTTYEKMTPENGEEHPPKRFKKIAMVFIMKHLTNANNAVIIKGPEGQIAIWPADESCASLFSQPLPLEDPGDAIETKRKLGQILRGWRVLPRFKSEWQKSFIKTCLEEVKEIWDLTPEEEEALEKARS